MGRKGRIYILPTRFGMVFLAGAILMVLVGAAYQNNLVNLLAFFMMSLVFVGMVQTHNNLRDVSVEVVEAESGFAGGNVLITTVLHNSSKESRFNLEAALPKRKAESVYENVHPLLSQSNLKLRSAYAAGQRGYRSLNEVVVSSVYPLGLFRAWIHLESKSSGYFVYPEPKGSRPFPAHGAEADLNTDTRVERGGDDFLEHRKYQAGDPPSHIDWKAYARGRPLLVKDFNEGAPRATLFDWSALEGIETEARLSQLCAWIEEARRRRVPFGLRLPGQSFPVSDGTAHATRCLEALAVYRSSEEPTASGRQRGGSHAAS